MNKIFKKYNLFYNMDFTLDCDTEQIKLLICNLRKKITELQNNNNKLIEENKELNKKNNDLQTRLNYYFHV